MVEVDHLFDGYGEEGCHNNRIHMSEIVGLLGHPPQDFLRRSPHTWRLFDENGKLSILYESSISKSSFLTTTVRAGRWKASPPISPTSLEDKVRTLSGESKTQFTEFLRCMLCWLLEERSTAHALLDHPWLRET